MLRLSLRTWLWASAVVCLLAGCRGPGPDQSADRAPGKFDSPPLSAAESPARTNDSKLPAVEANASAASADALPDHILAWDAREKTYKAGPDDDTAAFTFNVTNVSPADVVIDSTATSCGCTVAELPADPWRLSPGGHGKLDVTMDLNGQTGTVEKEVMVFTSKGNVTLTVKAEIPEPETKPDVK